ncbi:MAG: hypothetical protein KG075_23690 [Alphaproteobacteria bacterium]|nr:hypothetical protein [Alphaproteobacteria bacterium]
MATIVGFLRKLKQNFVLRWSPKNALSGFWTKLSRPPVPRLNPAALGR